LRPLLKTIFTELNITVARVYNTRNVDELILLDIDASKQNRAIDAFTIKDVATELFMPLTVGGGIRSVADVQSALQMGADKVAINSEALKRPEVIKETSMEFGCQCIVASIDVIKKEGKYFNYSNGKINDSIDLFDWILTVVEYGAGELLINNVNADGTMEGADLELVEKIVELVTIPVIYAGGVKSPEDCGNVVKRGASAVAVASLFHFTGITPLDCKIKMANMGLDVRI